jgi:DNA-binding PadR family transcriptional regulator
MSNVEDFLPLAPATLHIMMALVGQKLHGYGIMREIKETTEDRYKLGPGTLYDNLQRLLDQGLVQETAGPSSQDPRRRYYRLTALGQAVIVAEMDRLEAAFETVKARLKPPKPRKA